MFAIIKPYIPRVADKNINIYLTILREFATSILGITNEDIAVTANIIIIIGLTIPALTAASPSITPPYYSYSTAYRPGKPYTSLSQKFKHNFHY